jgi:hypothetical protein
MKIFNKFKMKIRFLLERIKLSESDYITMKAQSQMYKAMMSTVKYSSNTVYEDIVDDTGNLINRIPKSNTAIVHVNVTEMLAEGGVTFNKNVVKLIVTGL